MLMYGLTTERIYVVDSCKKSFVCLFQSRKEILKIHTRQWKPAPSEEFLEELAEKCVGEKMDGWMDRQTTMSI